MFYLKKNKSEMKGRSEKQLQMCELTFPAADGKRKGCTLKAEFCRILQVRDDSCFPNEGQKPTEDELLA